MLSGRIVDKTGAPVTDATLTITEIQSDSKTSVDQNEEVKPFKVQVRDERGMPVKNAKVAISYIYKDQDDDDRAAILVNYKPVDGLGELMANMPLRAISISVEVLAEGFVKFHESVKPPAMSMVAQLKEGRIIKVRAVDDNGVLLKNVWPILGGVYMHRQAERFFQPDENAIFVSRTISKQRRWMRVVGITDEDALLFSDLIDSTDESIVGEAGIIHAKLSPGIKLTGVLDESVPRPIKNGFVDICIAEVMGYRIPSVQENQSASYPTGFIWRETVSVEEDGTFEVKSLPPGGHLQLFAFVDGFQSRLPTVAEINNYLMGNQTGGWQSARAAGHRILPQLYSLKDDDNDGIVSVTIPCTPTAKLQVKVLTPLGSPIADAKVTVSPNGRFLPNINFLPGVNNNFPQLVRGHGGFIFGGGFKKTRMD